MIKILRDENERKEKKYLLNLRKVSQREKKSSQSQKKNCDENWREEKFFENNE